MTTDLTIGLLDRPGTLAHASDALGRAGVNIDGAFGIVVDGRGVFHVLVQDAERARRALMDSGFEIQGERAVLVVPIENRPGAAARLLRTIAEAGVNLELVYTTVEGQLVLGGDTDALRRAIG